MEHIVAEVFLEFTSLFYVGNQVPRIRFFSVWAGFSERTREGNKFVVAERPTKQERKNYCAETTESIVEERSLKRENTSNGFFDESVKDDSSSNLLDGLFDS